MNYVTEAELAEYLAIDIDQLPDDVLRLIKRASEMIDYYTRNRIDEDNSNHLEAAKLATLAQIEQWIEIGDEGIIKLQEVSIASFQVQFSDGDNRGLSELAERAKRALFLKGLLYIGVDVR